MPRSTTSHGTERQQDLDAFAELLRLQQEQAGEHIGPTPTIPRDKLIAAYKRWIGECAKCPLPATDGRLCRRHRIEGVLSSRLRTQRTSMKRRGRYFGLPRKQLKDGRLLIPRFDDIPIPTKGMQPRMEISMRCRGCFRTLQAIGTVRLVEALVAEFRRVHAQPPHETQWVYAGSVTPRVSNRMLRRDIVW